MKQKYTKEVIKSIAGKYTSKKEFIANDPNVYGYMRRKGEDFSKEACAHMTQLRRKHTDESLKDIAKEFMSRTELQRGDASAYSCIRKKGKQFMNEACEHMIQGRFSIAQLMCKKIFENILDSVCVYDTRKVITPYEIDIWFKEFNLAIEYNGKFWHAKECAIRRDAIKKKICEDRGIHLITIYEGVKDYETEVRHKIIEILPLINNITKKQITTQNVLDVDCSTIWDDILKSNSIDEINKKIKKCKNIKEFKEKHYTNYKYIHKSGNTDMLDCIREKENENLSDVELMRKCSEITHYAKFITDHKNLYTITHRRGLLDSVAKNMILTNRRYRFHKHEDIINLAGEYKNKSSIEKGDCALFKEINKREDISWSDILFLAKRKF
jgi:hypothetical protein